LFYSISSMWGYLSLTTGRDFSMPTQVKFFCIFLVCLSIFALLVMKFQISFIFFFIRLFYFLWIFILLLNKIIKIFLKYSKSIFHNIYNSFINWLCKEKIDRNYELVLNTYIVRTYSSKVNTFHHVGIITTHVLLLSRRVTLLKVITKVEQHFKVICLKERISNHKRLRLFSVRSDVILDLIMLSTKDEYSRGVSLTTSVAPSGLGNRVRGLWTWPKIVFN